jgi:ABC-2 type transport system ATP-binding protein
LIEVKNLVKKYGSHIAVDHLSFTVEKGEILGFLGPNGAGKSTTMNMMTGYISATEGTVEINGYDVYDDPVEAKKSIGYLPEMPPVYPEMTVEEYLNFVMNLKKVPKKAREKMLADIMYKTQITDMADRLIKHLSKGYRQRVGLAQAIVGYPEVIILDEPTVGLDPEQIIEVRSLIKKLAEEHTVLISSHILSEIKEICDKVLIINHGKKVVMDKIENLPKHLANASTLTLEVKGSKSDVTGAVRSVDAVTKADVTEGTEKDTVIVEISTDNSRDIRSDLFYTLAKANLPILKEEPTSLEDIFIAMTKPDAVIINDDAASPAADGKTDIKADRTSKSRTDDNKKKKLNNK